MLDISLFKAHQNSRFWVFISILLLAFIPWLNLSQTKHHFVLLLPHPFITFGFLYFFSLDIVTIVNFESNLLYILWASWFIRRILFVFKDNIMARRTHLHHWNFWMWVYFGLFSQYIISFLHVRLRPFLLIDALSSCFHCIDNYRVSDYKSYFPYHHVMVIFSLFNSFPFLTPLQHFHSSLV